MIIERVLLGLVLLVYVRKSSTENFKTVKEKTLVLTSFPVKVQGKLQTNKTSVVIREKCKIYIKNEKVVADCSNKGLTSFPKLPNDTQIANISVNDIRNITEDTLDNMLNLEVLDISNNPIVQIDTGAFAKLALLSELFIRNSELNEINITHINAMVANLYSLEILSLTIRKDVYKLPFVEFTCRNQSNGNNFVSSNIKKIKYLELDSSYFYQSLESVSNFGSEGEWTVEELDIWNTPNGFITYFSRSCFRNMTKLRALKIRTDFPNTLFVTIDYKLSTYEDSTFNDLVNLNEFVMEQASLDGLYVGDQSLTVHFKNITTSLSSLKQFKTLIFRGVEYARDPLFSFSDGLLPLTNSSTLTYLEFSRGGVTATLSVYLNFPDSLSVFQVNQNCISFIYIILQAGHWPLERLEAQDQNFCISEHVRGRTLGRLGNGYQTQIYNTDFSTKHLVYTNSMYRVELNLISRLSNLTYLDLSGNKHADNDKVLSNLSEALPFLEYFDISGYTLESIEETGTFQTNLKFLNLSANKLGAKGGDHFEVFRFYPSLQELRLSQNKIHSLTEALFFSQRHLRILDLSQNLLKSLDFSLRHMRELELLNLSDNSLQSLNKRNIRDLDFLASSTLFVDLTGNLFTCDCHSLTFLQWMQKTDVNFVNFQNYRCVKSDHTQHYFSDLRHLIRNLEKECKSYTVLIVVVSVLLAFTLAVLVAGLIYRYRWKLRYIYYMTRLQFKSGSTNIDYEQLFDFDAFISYAASDHDIAAMGTIKNLEERKGHQLCIHERDFEPGESIAYNISKGIHGSRRTILFLSKAFLVSEWCIYEMNIARMESLYKKRNVILIVLLEDIPVEDLPLDILDLVRTYTYLEYPRGNDSEDNLEVFWSKCSNFLSE